MIAGVSDLVEALRSSGLVDDHRLGEIGENLTDRFADSSSLARELVHRGWLTSYQAEQLLQGNGAHLVLDQYILLDLLGEGGMGQVFRARHRRMNRVVALKIIHKERVADRKAIQRFNREIQAAAQLSHPNVVIAYDADEVNDTLFFVMEYVEGTDLSNLVHRHGPLPVGAACDYVRQAALGLQHAFERGLVHRDIKPSNLLLTAQDGVVKVLDMGLARLREAADDDGPATQLTREGVVMGTPDYMAPEQAVDSHKVDIRADIYSLGCSLYFLLAGRLPYPEGNTLEKLYKHRFEEPQPIEEVRVDLPPDLLAVMRKMMAKQPEDRYQTPAEVAAALVPFAIPDSRAGIRLAPTRDPNLNRPKVNDPLETLLRPTEVQATMQAATEAYIAPLSSPVPGLQGTVIHGISASVVAPPSDTQPVEPRSLPPRAKRPWIGLTLAGTAVLLAAGVLSAIWFARSKEENQAALGTTAVQPAAVALEGAKTEPERPKGPKAPEKPGQVNPPPKEIPKAKPDGGKAAVPVQPPRPEPARITEGEIFSMPVGQGKHVAFSADGRHVVIAVANLVTVCRLGDTQAAVVRDDLVAERPVDMREISEVSDVAISADGQQVVFGSVIRPKIQRARALAFWEMNNRLPLRFFQKEDLTKKDENISCVAISPKGLEALAFIKGGREIALVALTADNSKANPKHRLGRALSSAAAVREVQALAFSNDGQKALSGGRDGKVRLWDLVTGREKDTNTFTSNLTKGFVTCVAFSPPDDRFLAAGCANLAGSEVHLWDSYQDYKKLESLKGFAGAVRSVVFSPEGSRILTGSDDGAVRLWDRQTGKLLFKDSHSGPVLAVAFYGDGDYAVSASEDNTIRRWKLPKR